MKKTKPKKRERSLVYRKFASKLVKAIDCDYFYYKIPDTFGIGGKRPFDAFLIIKGVFFAIEFKSEGDHLEKYQAIHLQMVEACGSVAMVYTDGECMDTFINSIKEKANLYSKERR